MAAAQAMAKGSVGSLGRRRGAEAARVGGSWRKSSFLGGRLAVGPRRPGPVFRILVTSPAQIIESPESSLITLIPKDFLSFDMAAASSLEQMNLSFGKAMKWWQKGLQPNMRAIQTAQDLVDSLTDAGDGLVVVDFFSPGCAGCHALHPKICQFAERNPDVQFLQVNYEEHKSMCYSLHVHVFPFFRFYRGAQGRLCSFSCTNATIKKFRDVLAKHRADRCSLGPTRGLEESELLALAANMDLQFTYTKELELAPSMEDVTEVIAADRPRLPTVTTPLARQGSEDRALVSSGR